MNCGPVIRHSADTLVRWGRWNLSHVPPAAVAACARAAPVALLLTGPILAGAGAVASLSRSDAERGPAVDSAAYGLDDYADRIGARIPVHVVGDTELPAADGGAALLAVPEPSSLAVLLLPLACLLLVRRYTRRPMKQT